jgi:phage gpG-like protein
MYIRFGIEGTTELSRNLLGIAQTARDWTPAFAKSGEDLIEFFSYEVFESEGAAIDAPWQALDPRYAKAKEKKYPDSGILQATGTMRQSFMQRYDATSLTIWNAAEYFKYHQSNQPRTRLPRRVMMRLTEDLKQMIVKNFHTYFMETVNA